MNFEAAKKKLERYGFTVNANGNSYSRRYLYYCATKGEHAITFCLDTTHKESTVTDIKVRYNEDHSVKISSISAAIRETCGINARAKNLDPKKARVRIAQRHSRGLRISDEEIQTLGICSADCANKVMAEAFPIMLNRSYRKNRRGDVIRHRLGRQATELWNRAIEVHKVNFPNQAPLRRVQVTTQVNKSDNLSLDNYQSTAVTGDMPIFAWDSREATQTVRMMLGEFATARDLGIVAIGEKEKALAIYASASENCSATNSVKYEMRRMEDELREVTRRLETTKARLEFAKKKMEIASFIDGIASMTSMLEGAG